MKFTILDEIVERVKQRLSADKVRWPIHELKKRLIDAPPVTSFANAISGQFGLIAEIKRRSPSQGLMLRRDVSEVARVYQSHSFVRAVSVLTNRDDFEMSIADLENARKLIRKPILRKDFIFDEYQVYEARAFGADAILLMANILTDPKRMQGLFDLTTDLGMDVLFECRDKKEIESIPVGARIYGINSRKLRARKVFGLSRYSFAKWLKPFGVRDRSTQYPIFELVHHIPKGVLRVAESGLVPSQINRIADYHYNAALVGTAILNDPNGVSEALEAFRSPLRDNRFSVHEVIHSR
jgi:indole-3-glycerol phosphate synthase